MRQFDTYQSYLDNLGNPLVGRIRFCNIDGSPSEIFDFNGNSLQNPILTDSSGKTAVQVFLDDHDYLVYFEKYIGGAVMAEDVEDMSWEVQGSSINRYNTIGIEVDVDGGGFQSVENMDDLRRLDPATSSSTVVLLGYRTLGDKPAVFYVWNGNSSAVSDGGSVVSPDIPGMSKGRWILVPSFNYVDVRHFGAFPSSLTEDNVEQRLAIQNASEYANKIGATLYFYADDIAFNYDVSGLTINRVDSSENSRLYNCTDMDTVISNVKTVYCLGNTDNDRTGRIVVRGDRLVTSFNVNVSDLVVLEPKASITFDTDYTTRGITKYNGVECIVSVDQTSSMRFENCTFSGSGKFMDEVAFFFTGCYIKESMFENYQSGFVACDGCYTIINDWVDVGKYIDFMFDSGCTDFELYGRKVTQNLNFEGKRISFANGEIDGEVRCLMFKGVNVKVGSVKADDYDVSNCEMTVSGDLSDIRAVNSKIHVENDIWVTSDCNIVNCELRGMSGVRTLKIYPVANAFAGNISNVRIKDCVFNYIEMEFSAYPYGRDTVCPNIKVDNFVFADNIMPEREDKSIHPIKVIDGQIDCFADTQGRYQIVDNTTPNGAPFAETRIEGYDYSWGGTISIGVDTAGNKIVPSDQLNLSRFVFSFGESRNQVDYQCTSLLVKSIHLEWHGSDSGKLDLNNIEVNVKDTDSGYNNIKVSWLGDSPISPSEGHVSITGRFQTSVLFTRSANRKSTEYRGETF